MPFAVTPPLDTCIVEISRTVNIGVEDHDNPPWIDGSIEATKWPAMDDKDTRIAAQQMRHRYGSNAEYQAGLRAGQLLAEGDSDGFAAWTRIGRAIDQLSKIEASKNDSVN